MEWTLGIFTIMAVMAAIIGGGTGVRVMHIDVEYRKKIDSIKKQKSEAIRIHGYDRMPIGILSENKTTTDNLRDQDMKHEENLSDIYGKQDRNRKGVMVDGSCMGIILTVALVTALDFSPSLLASVIIVIMSFVVATIPFYSHLRNVMGRTPLE